MLSAGSSLAESGNPNLNRVAEKTRQLLGWGADYPPAPVSTPSPSFMTMNYTTESPAHINSYTNQRTRTPASPSNYPYSLIGKACTSTRKRKNSCSSVSSAGSEMKPQMTPPASPRNPSVTITCMPVNRSFTSLPVSPVSPNTPLPNPPGSYSSQDPAVFSRLKELVPTVPTDQNQYHMMLQFVTNVVQMEGQIQELDQQIFTGRQMLEQQQPYHQPYPIPPTYSPQSDMSADPVPDDLAQVDVTAFKSLVSPLTVDTSSSQFHY